MKIDVVTFIGEVVLPDGRQKRVIDTKKHAHEAAAYDLDLDPRLRLVRVRCRLEKGDTATAYLPLEQVALMVIDEKTVESERQQPKK